jgi:hypothetical protein
MWIPKGNFFGPLGWCKRTALKIQQQARERGRSQLFYSGSPDKRTRTFLSLSLFLFLFLSPLDNLTIISIAREYSLSPTTSFLRSERTNWRLPPLVICLAYLVSSSSNTLGLIFQVF